MWIWLIGLLAAAGAVAKSKSSGKKAPRRVTPVAPTKAPAPKPVVVAPPVQPVSRRGESVIISLMALRNLEWWPGPDRPRLVEFPGAGSGHPSWHQKVARMRDGKGRALPALRRMFGIPKGARLALVGFSAGSNSGLRALLESPYDREEIDFVGSFDGLHWALKDRSLWNPAQPMSPYFSSQYAGILDFATQAATGERGMVVTASSVAAPRLTSGQVSQTSRALADLLLAVGQRMGRIAPPADPYTQMRGTRADRALPPAVLARIAQQTGGVQTAAIGRFRAVQTPDKGTEAHLLQARLVAPLTLSVTLGQRWTIGA